MGRYKDEYIDVYIDDSDFTTERVKEISEKFKDSSDPDIKYMVELLAEFPYLVKNLQDDILYTARYFAPNEDLGTFREVFPLLLEQVAFWGCDHINHNPFTKEGCKGFEDKTIFCLNVNDEFVTACADAEKVPSDKWHEVAEIYAKYGRMGLSCWASLTRGKELADYMRNCEDYKTTMPLIKAEYFKEDKSNG